MRLFYTCVEVEREGAIGNGRVDVLEHFESEINWSKSVEQRERSERSGRSGRREREEDRSRFLRREGEVQWHPPFEVSRREGEVRRKSYPFEGVPRKGADFSGRL